MKEMLQRIRKLRAVEAGFTLIELLIVVVILGVLAGIVVFAVSNFNNDGVTAACKSDIKNVEIASEAYLAKTGGVAGSMQLLKDSNYLKDVPASDKYFISYSAGATEATVTGHLGSAAAPGADCTA